MSTIQQHRPDADRIWIVQPGGRSNCYSGPEGRFTIVASGKREIRTYLRKDLYSLANAFVCGEINVRATSSPPFGIYSIARSRISVGAYFRWQLELSV